VTREGDEEYYKRRAVKNLLHPIVRTHPVSGRKGLYVSPRFTVGIEGMDDAEAQPLLDTLFAYQTAPGNVYRHKWRLGRFRDVGQSQRQSPGLRWLCAGRHPLAASHVDTRRPTLCLTRNGCMKKDDGLA
jgi:hypothetical protein